LRYQFDPQAGACSAARAVQASVVETPFTELLQTVYQNIWRHFKFYGYLGRESSDWFDI
jgi:hypothetical protein